MRQLLDVNERHGGCVLAVERVSEEEIVNYGSIDADVVEDRVHKVKRIIEKPRPEEAPSLLGTVGRYVMTSDIWPLLEQTPPTPPNREMFLTDTIQMLIDGGGDVFACEYTGDRFDAGRPAGLLKASIYEALKRPDLADDLRAYLRSVLE